MLSEMWKRAISGDLEAQTQWGADGGAWTWQADGVSARGTGPEWIELVWRGWDASFARGLKNFGIKMTIQGKAEAAGLSFGAYKDFLADVGAEKDVRHLHLEVDGGAGCWGFRVDGRLMSRLWWNGAVAGVDDLINGALR